MSVFFSNYTQQSTNYGSFETAQANRTYNHYYPTRMRTQELSVEVFRRLSWVAHIRNQYETSNARLDCAGIAIATLHQLLLNPNPLAENSWDIFEKLLQKGSEHCKSARALINANIEATLPTIYSFLKGAFLEGGPDFLIARIHDYHGWTNEKLFETHLENLLYAWINIFSENSCTTLVNQMIENHPFWSKIRSFDQFWNEIFLPIAEVLSRDFLADFLLDHLFKLISFKREDQSFLNINEGLESIAEKTMTRIFSGKISSYTTLLIKLEECVKSWNKAVGAIIHIDDQIFSIVMYPGREILIADSHGIPLISHPKIKTNPFSVVMIDSWIDTRELLNFYKPIHGKENTACYLYILDESIRSTPLNPHLFAQTKAFAEVELVRKYSKFKAVQITGEFGDLSNEELSVLAQYNYDISERLTQLRINFLGNLSEETIMEIAYRARLGQLRQEEVISQQILLNRFEEVFRQEELDRRVDPFKETITQLEGMDPELRAYYLYRKNQVSSYADIPSTIANIKEITASRIFR